MLFLGVLCASAVISKMTVKSVKLLIMVVSGLVPDEHYRLIVSRRLPGICRKVAP